MEGSLGVMGHWGYGGSEVIERLWGSFRVRGQGGVMGVGVGVTLKGTGGSVKGIGHLEKGRG